VKMAIWGIISSYFYIKIKYFYYLIEKYCKIITTVIIIKKGMIL